MPLLRSSVQFLSVSPAEAGSGFMEPAYPGLTPGANISSAPAGLACRQLGHPSPVAIWGSSSNTDSYAGVCSSSSTSLLPFCAAISAAVSPSSLRMARSAPASSSACARSTLLCMAASCSAV